MSLLQHAVEPEPSADDAERRIAPRTKTLKRAKVYFNNMNSTFDCIVRNISATGALLTLDDSAHLPREFEVRIGEERMLRPAQLVYRRGMLAGIHFLDGAQAAEPPMPAVPPDVMNAVLGPQAADAKGIRRVPGERLPLALVRNVRWFPGDGF